MTALAICYIDTGDRLRQATEEQVAALAESMAEVGLLCPITVYEREVIRAGIATPGFGLVAGLHRLEAAKRLGWSEIEAHVVTLPDLQRQLAECDENLCGATLTKAERALFTMRRKHIYEALHPEARAQVRQGHIRQGAADDNLAPAFASDTAARTGRSERDVQRDATRGERIGEEVLEQIRGTAEDKGVVLDRLARAPDAASELAAIRSGTRPAPAIKNAFESEEDWRRALFTVWNRGAQDWRDRAMEAMDRPVFDRARAAG